MSEIVVDEFSWTVAISCGSAKQCIQKPLCCHLLSTIAVAAVNHSSHIRKICLLLVSMWPTKRPVGPEVGGRQLVRD